MYDNQRVNMVGQQQTHSIQILNEGEEPDNFFWVGIGGKKKYPQVVLFISLKNINYSPKYDLIHRFLFELFLKIFSLVFVSQTIVN